MLSSEIRGLYCCLKSNPQEYTTEKIIDVLIDLENYAMDLENEIEVLERKLEQSEEE